MTDKKRRLAALFAALVVAAGCASAPTSSKVARSFENTHPDCRVERDSRMVFGMAKLTAVRGLLNLTGQGAGQEARAILHHLRRIEISTYSVAAGCELHGATLNPLSLFEAEGWAPMVTDLSANDPTWVMVREDTVGGTAGLLVISLGPKELEIVRLDGRIDALLMEAVARHPAGASGLFSGES